MEAFNFTAASEDCNLYTYDMRKLQTAACVHKVWTCPFSVYQASLPSCHVQCACCRLVDGHACQGADVMHSGPAAPTTCQERMPPPQWLEHVSGACVYAGLCVSRDGC
jgi:hypothetical protein